MKGGIVFTRIRRRFILVLGRLDPTKKPTDQDLIWFVKSRFFEKSFVFIAAVILALAASYLLVPPLVELIKTARELNDWSYVWSLVPMLILVTGGTIALFVYMVKNTWGDPNDPPKQ